MINFRVLASLIFLGFPQSNAWAHQPVLVDSAKTEVIEPEVSKGFYGTLSGAPHIYIVRSSKPFDLFVDLLIPNLPIPQKDVMAEIRKDGHIVATIGGPASKWSIFFEPYGQSTYWLGGNYKRRSDPGEYIITVSSPVNDHKYVLGIGDKEQFGITEILRTLHVVPQLKRDFFEESPASLIWSPFGWGYVLAIFVFSGVVYFLSKLIFKRRPQKLFVRAGLLLFAVAILFVAICTSWSAWLLFLSGLLVFESAFQPSA